MKTALRIVAGTVLIGLGTLILFSSLSIWPHPFSWSQFSFLFAPVFVVGVGFVAIGWAVFAGMSYKKMIELILFLWR